MKLELDRLDLNIRYGDIPTSKVSYEHFNKSAQVAILAVGRATFYEFDRQSYNAVHPPAYLPLFSDDVACPYCSEENHVIALPDEEVEVVCIKCDGVFITSLVQYLIASDIANPKED